MQSMISPIGTENLPALRSLPTCSTCAEAPPVAASAAAPPSDAVELSAASRAYNANPEPAGVSPERLAEVKRQIKDGSYLTDDKLDAVAERILRDIFQR